MERNILKRIYGIEVGKESTKEISSRFSLSEKEIIEIHNQALHKLYSHNMEKQKKHIKK